MATFYVVLVEEGSLNENQNLMENIAVRLPNVLMAVKVK